MGILSRQVACTMKVGGIMLNSSTFLTVRLFWKVDVTVMAHNFIFCQRANHGLVSFISGDGVHLTTVMSFVMHSI